MKKFIQIIWQFCSYLFVPQIGKQKRKQEQLKKDITYIIGKEIADGNQDVITPSHISKVLNVPLEEVERCIKDNNFCKADR